jgi:LysM repeat protein
MKSVILALLFTVSVVSALWAQDPGAEQDVIAERQKILRAADQLDLLTQQNTQLAQQITALQERLLKLETVNGELRGQLAQQQRDWIVEKEKLLKEVSKIVSSGGNPVKAAEITPNRSEQGYEYVVQQGQSLWAIADAYQKSGVNVTVEDIRGANNLGKNDMLKVGQKLFIPKK